MAQRMKRSPVPKKQSSREDKLAVLAKLREMQGKRTKLEGKPGEWLELNEVGSLNEIIRRACRRAGLQGLDTHAYDVIARWLRAQGYRDVRLAGGGYIQLIRLDDPPARTAPAHQPTQ